jgi:hypothetical protein
MRFSNCDVYTLLREAPRGATRYGTRGLLLVTLLAGALNASGCDDSSGADGAAKGDDTNQSMLPATQADADAGPAVTEQSLVGTYAAQIKYRDVLSVSIVGTNSMLTNILAVAAIREDPSDHKPRLNLSLCSSRTANPYLKHLMDLVLTVPAQVLNATHLDPAVVHLTGSGSSMTWSADEVHGSSGWSWTSPSDDMPVLPDDPRVVDQDGDGNPGVTLNFNGHVSGSLYLAMVYRFMFSGTVAANGDLTGTTLSTSKESLLGSDLVFLTCATITRMADSDTSTNTVRFVRQADGFDCDKLIAGADAIFPPE